MALRCECSTTCTCMYTNMNGEFVHVCGEMGLLRASRAHVKLLRAYVKLLREHVKLLRAHVEGITCACKRFSIYLHQFSLWGSVQSNISTFKFKTSAKVPFIFRLSDNGVTVARVLFSDRPGCYL